MASVGLRRIVQVISSVLAVYFAYAYVQRHRFTNATDDNGSAGARQAVEKVFLESWEDYVERAWGYDVFNAASGRGHNFGKKPLGWMIVDALDTMMLMQAHTTDKQHRKQLRREVKRCEAWIRDELDYDMDTEVNVFETTIRMLGGLLSAHHLAETLGVGTPSVYAEKAADLGARLAHAFTASPVGIPYSSVNLRTGAAVKSPGMGEASLSEFTTLQLEFKQLAYVTGNATYWKLAEAVYTPFFRENDYPAAYDGIAPVGVLPDSGKFFSPAFKIGARGDSYYEYLLKQYLQTREPLYWKLYQTTMAGMEKHMIARSIPDEYVYIGERYGTLHGPFTPQMDHLVCFIGGLYAMAATEGKPIAKAEQQSWWDRERAQYWQLAEALTYTCYRTYQETPTGLAAEISFFRVREEETHNSWWESPSHNFFIKPTDVQNLQRPETAESIMYLWHLSGDSKYRQWNWQLFEAFRNKTAYYRHDGSLTYTSINSVVAEGRTTPRDNMESFWLAETLKYIYLTFVDEYDLSKIVFNTEAHPLPVLDPEELARRGLVTGWDL
ncbi:AaceriAER165Wp [[Ashbya] aceris (nom. inval.)]|nr:AaceriAER165Wp [[Ashbya] aceris (nom. inval.)]